MTSGRKLGRQPKHRKALFRNLVTSLFEHERIETTLAKAKEIRPLVEKCIHKAKSGSPESIIFLRKTL
jgi:large subunit ribosomal protein L17